MREAEVEKLELRSKTSLFKILILLLKEAFSKSTLLLIKNGCILFHISFYHSFVDLIYKRPKITYCFSVSSVLVDGNFGSMSLQNVDNWSRFPHKTHSKKTEYQSVWLFVVKSTTTKLWQNDIWNKKYGRFSIKVKHFLLCSYGSRNLHFLLYMASRVWNAPTVLIQYAS